MTETTTTNWPDDLRAREDEGSGLTIVGDAGRILTAGRTLARRAELVADLLAYITSLNARAVAAKKALGIHDVRVHVFGDGKAFLRVGAHECGGVDVPLAEAMAAAEDYLLRDDLADLNRTLGLSPDGRMEAA